MIGQKEGGVGFKPARCDLHHMLPSDNDEFVNNCPTVVLLVIFGNAILLVQSAKDSSRRTWVPPQGGIKWYDGTLIQAAFHKGFQELRLQEERIVKRKVCVLGEFLNPIPKDRGQKDKLCFFVAMPTWLPEITLDRANSKYMWVTSPEFLETVMGPMAETRPVKVAATKAAINEAHRRKLLPWRCESHELLVA